MRIRTLAAAALLLSLSLSFIFPAPARALDLVLSPAEGGAGTDVTIAALSGYGVGEFRIFWDGSQLLEQGNEAEQNDAGFTVPEDTGGAHTVSLEIGGYTYEADFTILPSLDLSDTGGAAHSSLSVTGTGFNANENNIELFWDETSVGSAIAADSRGRWQTTIQVPVSPAGVHNITAGGTTPREEVPPAPFEVMANVAINPNSGSVGTMVEIEGSGFSNGETGITIVYDGTAVKTAVTANAGGTWYSSFFVPASSKGSHRVTAYGETTPQGNVKEVTFTVAPILKAEMVSGYPGEPIHTGDDLWLSGIGFEENEGGIQVTYDGMTVASGIKADARGSWAIRVQVPASTSGSHIISASGETTVAGTIEDAILIVSPQLQLGASTAAIGERITINGTGFGAGSEITVSLDGNRIDEDAATDAKGNFNAGFTVPAIGAGEHIITVSDSDAAVASAKFALESTPPPVPTLLVPEAGSRIGFFGGSVVSFQWEEVEDPSGVIYTLEIGQDPDLSDRILLKEKLIRAEYTLRDEEALERGTYYWRVKAIDGAGNESEWTVEQVFKVGFMEWWVIPVIILALVVVIIIVRRVVVMSRRGEWK